jgi:glycosyltransferase involved in cell wall biosynthesis
LFKEETASDFKLLIAGAILWTKTEIENEYDSNPFKKDIKFTGRVNEAQLGDMLGAAYALSFVPVFEGFGLPIVEAMQSGVPVICSNVTSMPEVAGDAALLVDPFDIKSITGAMKQLHDNKDGLRDKLIAKGFEQKIFFTWEKTAGLLWNSIDKAIKE